MLASLIVSALIHYSARVPDSRSLEAVQLIALGSAPAPVTPPPPTPPPTLPQPTIGSGDPIPGASRRAYKHHKSKKTAVGATALRSIGHD